MTGPACASAGIGCPFSSAAMDRAVLIDEVMLTALRAACPSSDVCGFMASNAFPVINGRRLVHLSPQASEVAGSKPHPCLQIMLDTMEQNSNSNPEIVKYLRSTKCPQFSEISSHISLPAGCSLDALYSAFQNCPAFGATATFCPFDAAKSTYRELPQLFAADNQKQCPFMGKMKVQKTKSHPMVKSLKDITKCSAFKKGCPFSSGSSDSNHRLLGMTSESLATIRSKCPAWSNGACPFSEASNAHPSMNGATMADLRKCPAFSDGECVFDVNSPSISAHPNIGHLFSKISATECPAFSTGCVFNMQPESYSASRARQHCPGFTGKQCPFKAVVTSQDMFEVFTQIPATHHAALAKTSPVLAKLLSLVWSAKTVSIAAEDILDDDDDTPSKPIRQMSGGVSLMTIGAGEPAAKKRKVSHEISKDGATEFSQAFNLWHSSGNSSKEKSSEAIVIEGVLKKCPYFTEPGKCPFTG